MNAASATLSFGPSLAIAASFAATDRSSARRCNTQRQAGPRGLAAAAVELPQREAPLDSSGQATRLRRLTRLSWLLGRSARHCTLSRRAQERSTQGPRADSTGACAPGNRLPFSTSVPAGRLEPLVRSKAVPSGHYSHIRQKVGLGLGLVPCLTVNATFSRALSLALTSGRGISGPRWPQASPTSILGFLPRTIFLTTCTDALAPPGQRIRTEPFGWCHRRDN